jgi:hypothetical protein
MAIPLATIPLPNVVITKNGKGFSHEWKKIGGGLPAIETTTPRMYPELQVHQSYPGHLNTDLKADLLAVMNRHRKNHNQRFDLINSTLKNLMAAIDDKISVHDSLSISTDITSIMSTAHLKLEKVVDGVRQNVEDRLNGTMMAVAGYMERYDQGLNLIIDQFFSSKAALVILAILGAALLLTVTKFLVQCTQSCRIIGAIQRLNYVLSGYSGLFECYCDHSSEVSQLAMSQRNAAELGAFNRAACEELAAHHAALHNRVCAAEYRQDKQAGNFAYVEGKRPADAERLETKQQKIYEAVKKIK